MDFLDNDLINGSKNDKMLDLTNTRKIDFFKKCLPGGRNAPIPRGSILHHTKPSQLPYNAKIMFL